MNERIFDLDMFQVVSGHVLTSYGTYAGPWIRARLSYAPDPVGKVLVGSTRCRKVSADIAAEIPGLRMVVPHPGEQQYLVPRESIVRMYRPMAASGLSENAMQWRELISTESGVTPASFKVGGGRSVGSIDASSDVDWVVHSTAIERIRTAVTADPHYQRDFHAGTKLLHEKYSHYSGLTRSDVEELHHRRWRHMRRRGEPFTLIFVDTAYEADELLGLEPSARRVTLRGYLRDTERAYFNPRCVTLESDGGTWTVLGRSAMYNGSFRDGDVVEISGLVAEANTGTFIYVERSDDYIRLLDASLTRRDRR